MAYLFVKPFGFWAKSLYS